MRGREDLAWDRWMKREWAKRGPHNWPPPIDSLPLTKEQLRSIILSDEDMDALDWEEETSNDDEQNVIIHNLQCNERTTTIFHSQSESEHPPSELPPSADEQYDELDDEEFDELSSSQTPPLEAASSFSSQGGAVAEIGLPQTSESHFSKSLSSGSCGVDTTTRTAQEHSVTLVGG